ncbi:hypothetical protein AN639_05935 [Candidatus Epulonipiscium fishelsonii]|uniref:Uncharacterized protein n=1 Tax=Candidatus Epulonipiscium fishelsonii TaxID=77094 RepID=A0ACC8X874_9FIRM|nr:hypothetical protein AN396_11840 [Epulopiscium sp. SCG-B11WGA-EpuloA1]ONI39607.1 hypothetical protein AN639_05935 [Epulopiscium sp. SCG-B05WGA-EpuloA1]
MENISKRINNVASTLNDLKNYQDIEGFITDLEYHVGQLSYFYDYLTPKQTGDPSTTFYRPKKMPQIHQIAYFNLTRGFPKELYGGHWCYVFKYFKSKYVIIPTTSVKEDSLPPDPEFQMDIEVDNFKNGMTTRLQLSDMRSIDLQRLYCSKGFYNVLTDRDQILHNVNKMLLEEH